MSVNKIVQSLCSTLKETKVPLHLGLLTLRPVNLAWDKVALALARAVKGQGQSRAGVSPYPTLNMRARLRSSQSPQSLQRAYDTKDVTLISRARAVLGKGQGQKK